MLPPLLHPLTLLWLLEDSHLGLSTPQHALCPAAHSGPTAPAQHKCNIAQSASEQRSQPVKQYFESTGNSCCLRKPFRLSAQQLMHGCRRGVCMRAYTGAKPTATPMGTFRLLGVTYAQPGSARLAPQPYQQHATKSPLALACFVRPWGHPALVGKCRPSYAECPNMA